MLRTKLAALGIVAGALAAPAFAAPASGGMVRSQDPQSLVRALQGAGYAAQLGTDKTGDPKITSGTSGTKFQIFFYNCTNHSDCRTVNLYSGYHLDKPTTVDRMNEFNQSKRFGRAYIDKDNDPVLEMDVDLDDGGMSDALFIDNIEYWTAILGDFEKFIGYRG